MMNKLRRMHGVTAGVAAAVFALSVLVPASPAAAAESDSRSISAAFPLRSHMNHKCLEILSFNNNNGAQVGMWDCWGGANQQWYWDGSMLRNTMNHKCLEILSFNNNNGARAGMWDCWGGSNQRWY